VPAIFPLFEFGVENVLVSTYQSISGAGKTFQTCPEIIDNIVPFIDGEEAKTEKEPLKIFGEIIDNEIQAAKFPKISSQCYRVPVSNGHTAAVFVKFKKSPDLNSIISKWQNFVPKIQKFNLPSATQNFLHYFNDKTRPQIKLDRNLENGMAIAIGGLRKDLNFDVKFVCMSHNTIRGAAGGAILTAELICHENFI
jgi:aspartate-semialdehyde dehydrogenase